MNAEQRVQCGLPPEKKTIIPPGGGWEPRTYYVVDVAFSSHNVVHRSIFYSGFLNGDNEGPGGYNVVWNASYEVGDHYPISKCHYLKVISKIEGIGK